MSTGITDDDRRRIESFCDTPPHERSPEDLVPDQQYADDVPMPGERTERSRLSAVWHHLRTR